MKVVCDGGGNRYQTEIKLTDSEPLRKFFNADVNEVVPGICSITAGDDKWVVCPRRLFAARSDVEGAPTSNYALREYEKEVLLNAGVPKGVRIGIWSEVTLKHRIADAEINYHFDYIAAPLVETSLTKAISSYELPLSSVKDELDTLVALARKNKYFRKGEKNPQDALILLPDLHHPYILEVMTASTSGSDTENETDMRSAFRNAMLEKDHRSPGINKRQVWGRMVTQLFAKTALAQQWRGRTVWIIQDELLRNIELTTRLNTSAVHTKSESQISLIVMRYNEHGKMSFSKKIEGDAGVLFGGSETFSDILLPKMAPPKTELFKAVLRRKLAAIVEL